MIIPVKRHAMTFQIQHKNILGFDDFRQFLKCRFNA